MNVDEHNIFQIKNVLSRSQNHFYDVCVCTSTWKVKRHIAVTKTYQCCLSKYDKNPRLWLAGKAAQNVKPCQLFRAKKNYSNSGTQADFKAKENELHSNYSKKAICSVYYVDLKRISLFTCTGWQRDQFPLISLHSASSLQSQGSGHHPLGNSTVRPRALLHRLDKLWSALQKHPHRPGLKRKTKSQTKYMLPQKGSKILT